MIQSRRSLGFEVIGSKNREAHAFRTDRGFVGTRAAERRFLSVDRSCARPGTEKVPNDLQLYPDGSSSSTTVHAGSTAMDTVGLSVADSRVRRRPRSVIGPSTRRHLHHGPDRRRFDVPARSLLANEIDRVRRAGAAPAAAAAHSTAPHCCHNELRQLRYGVRPDRSPPPVRCRSCPSPHTQAKQQTRLPQPWLAGSARNRWSTSP